MMLRATTIICPQTAPQEYKISDIT